MRVPTNNNFSNQYLMISMQYANLNKLYQQAATQNKLTAPSDDPVLSAHITNVSDYIEQLQSFDQNKTIAKNRASLFDTSLSTAVDTIDRARQIMVNAKNDTLSDQDRASLAKQIEGCLSDLLNVVNKKDASGYIFSGTHTNAPAFVQQNNKYIYQGGFDETSIAVGINVNVTFNESGYDVFDGIKSGNGTFSVTAANTNTGTAYMTPGAVVNATTYTPDDYTVSFATNTAGQTVFSITGATSGQVIPTPPTTNTPDNCPVYTSGMDMTFNGLTTTIMGIPNAGDNFNITPSANDNIFNTLQQLVNVLSTPIGNDPTQRALYHQQLSDISATIEQGFNQLNTHKSEIGTREIVINNEMDASSKFLADQQALLTSLAWQNPVETQTSISQQLVYLQATQSAYMEIQNSMMQLLKL